MECRRYGLRLAPEACARYRRDTPERCVGCVDFEDAVPLPKTIRFRKKGAAVTSSRDDAVVGAPKPKRVCSVPGCGVKHSAKGYCKKHYLSKVYAPRRRAKGGA